jgi:hypothetical protein
MDYDCCSSIQVAPQHMFLMQLFLALFFISFDSSSSHSVEYGVPVVFRIPWQLSAVQPVTASAVSVWLWLSGCLAVCRSVCLSLFLPFIPSLSIVDLFTSHCGTVFPLFHNFSVSQGRDF